MVEHWMEKYEKDVEQKQKELDILKASKAKDLERLQELTKLVTIPIFWLMFVNAVIIHSKRIKCCLAVKTFGLKYIVTHV